MLRLAIAGATALMSLGVATGFHPQPSDAGPDSGPGKTTAVETSETVTIVNSDEDDPAEKLHEAYLVLRQLRSERDRLEERPRALTEKAMGLYRDGLKAFEAGDLPRARTLGIASLELARAVELARQARHDETADDELPLPPRIARVRIRQGHATLEADQIKVLRAETIPPPIPADARTPETGKEKVESKTFTIRVPHTDVQGRVVVVRPAETLEVKGDDRRAFVVERINEELGKQLRQARVLVGPKTPDAGDSAAIARAHLRRAYDRIRDARETYKNEDAKVYLDAARDLYNAARREAEAGRNDRAVQLADAAASLTLVPRYLGELKQKPADKKTEDAGKDQSKRKTERRFEYRIPPLPGVPEQARVRVETSKKGEVHVHVETSDKETPTERAKKDKAAKAEKGKDHARAEETHGDVEGIGLVLTVEDDSLVVSDLVPDSPAARDGRIKPGDRLVGVETDDGETIEFDGKPLEESVKLIRGQTGTKVRLVIQPKDSDDRKVFELTRAKLPVHDLAPKAEVQEPEIEVKQPKRGEDQPEAEANVFRFQVPKTVTIKPLKQLGIGPIELELKLDLNAGQHDGEPVKDLPPPLDD